jgi:starvation-inducible outer membrane lipoprotein
MSAKIYPGPWKPSRVKVDSYRAWRVERQTGPDAVKDYEWATGTDGQPWQSHGEQEAIEEADRLNGR